MSKRKIVIPREVLLIEIERRCCVPDCNARNFIGLTKADARVFSGFACERCEEWNVDGLTELDVPEWWEELAITDLYAVRQMKKFEPDDPGEVISRMSDGYLSTRNGER